MPRYEFAEGSSHKFWQIELEGSSFTTTYGRVGTDGQMSLKEYDSPEKAKKEYDKLIAEKVKKGYLLAKSDASAPTAPATLPSIPVTPLPKATPMALKHASVFEDEGDDDDGDDEDDASKPKVAPPAQLPTPANGPNPVKGGGATKPGRVVADPSTAKAVGPRYFEFVEGSSSKFWEISLDDTSFTTRYGRLGTEGQMSMKEYDSHEKAQKEYDKLVAEKTRKGYVEKRQNTP